MCDTIYSLITLVLHNIHYTFDLETICAFYCTLFCDHTVISVNAHPHPPIPPRAHEWYVIIV